MSVPKLEPFKLEVFFQKYEFSSKYLLCCSDPESIPMRELVAGADEELKAMWNELRLGYTEARGSPMLRGICAEFYGLLAENILMFAGAEEGIFCCCSKILNESDHAIVLTPCYQSLLSVPSSVSSVTCVEMTEESGWDLDCDAVRRALQPNTKLIIINFPNNPTGSVISSEKLHALISIARERDLWLFSDEVYRGLEVDESDRLPLVASVYEKGISLGVLSKSLGLAGLRIGWIACQNLDLIDDVAGSKHYLSICNSAPSEVLAMMALRNNDTLLQRNRKIMVGNIAHINSFLSRWGHLFSWVQPKGGCCGFMKYHGDKISMTDLQTQLIDKYGVLILPGDNFANTGADISRNFRLGFGRLNFAEGLGALEAALRELDV